MKRLLLIIIVAIVVGSGAFYAGMKYRESKAPVRMAGVNFQNLQNLSPEERQQRLQETGGTGGGIRDSGVGNRTAGGFVSGEIISKDNESVAVKMPDGGSKIVFYSDSTEIDKFTDGTANDLEVGRTITVNGAVNPDGSVTARSIQLRPENTRE